MTPGGDGRLIAAVTTLTTSVDRMRAAHSASEKRSKADTADFRGRLDELNATVSEMRRELARQQGARIPARVEALENQPAPKLNGNLVKLSDRLDEVEGWAKEGGKIDRLRVTLIKWRSWIGGLAGVSAILSAYATIRSFFAP